MHNHGLVAKLDERLGQREGLRRSVFCHVGSRPVRTHQGAEASAEAANENEAWDMVSGRRAGGSWIGQRDAPFIVASVD